MLSVFRLFLGILIVAGALPAARAQTLDPAATRAQLAKDRPVWAGGRAPRASLPPHRKMWVQADVLRIRSAPSGDASAVASAPIGKSVFVLEQKPDAPGWVELYVAAEDGQTFTHQRGFAQEKFLTSLEGYQSLLAGGKPPEGMTEGAFAERLYASEPSPENLQRLIESATATGDRKRVAQLEKLKSYQADHHLAVCMEGELRWLMGGPYNEDLWRGNARNLKGVEVLETLSRSMQSFAWFKSRSAAIVEPRPFLVRQRFDWPWMMPLTAIRAGHSDVPVLDTREACVGEDGRLMGTFPTIEVRSRRLSQGDEGFEKVVAAARRIVSINYGRGERAAAFADINWRFAIMIGDEFRYAFVAGDLPASVGALRNNSDPPEAAILLEVPTGKFLESFGVFEAPGRSIDSFEHYKIPASDEQLVLVSETSTDPGYPLDRSRSYILGKAHRRSLGYEYRTSAAASFPKVSPAPVRDISDDLETRFRAERLQNGKPAPPAFNEATLPLRYHKPAKPPQRGESPGVLFSDLDAMATAFEPHDLKNSDDWTHVAYLSLTKVGEARLKAAGETGAPRVDIFLEGLNRLTGPIGAWVRLRVDRRYGKDPDESFLHVVASIAEAGRAQRVLSTYGDDDGSGLVIYQTDLNITGDGPIYRITPNGAPPVWIHPSEQELVAFDLRSKARMIADAVEVRILNDAPAVLRAAPRDDAAIVRSARIAEFAAAGREHYTHLQPIKVEGDWINVRRTDGGDEGLFYCGEDRDDMDVTEGWLRWRSPSGVIVVDWKDRMSC